MAVLRLIIYQPTAYYGMPFSFARKLTYPIPPYSTFIGFLCNICGIKDKRNDFYKKVISKLKISIAGRFKSKTTEYILYRNLNYKDHEAYYGSKLEREKHGQIGHPGGQIPTEIDVLEDVEVVVHLYHKDCDNLYDLLKKIEKPTERLQVLHLGRSEDWIVIKDMKFMKDCELKCEIIDGSYNYFFWIPENLYNFRPSECSSTEEIFKNARGTSYYITTFSKVEEYEKDFVNTKNRESIKVKAKLNDGVFVKSKKWLLDTDLNIPVFLGDFKDEYLENISQR